MENKGNDVGLQMLADLFTKRQYHRILIVSQFTWAWLSI